MNIQKTEVNGQTNASVHADSFVFNDEQQALDFIMSVSAETGSNRIILNKDAIADDFFNLRTGIAGNILQRN